MLKKYVLYICVITSIVFAQDVTVQGTVKDAETNEPLLGASIILKGTLLGTTTNNEGHFEISVPAENATLMFTYIGYKTSEVPVSSSSGMLNIMLESDVLNQEEVIVVGLASTVKRRNLANAVATVSAEELIPTPTQTLDDALSGKFSGVSIRRNTGAPGGGINVNLRGTSTLQGETQPIYIIDGVIINNFANQSGIDVVSEATGAGSATPQGQPSNRIGDINPNDIESMEILKGASAAALYGAKASNGVIIITTKKGSGGKTKFNLTQKMGTRSLVGKMGHRVFETYAEAKDQYGADIAALGLTNASDTTSWAGRDIDYEEDLYSSGDGALSETTVSMAGGNASTQFYASGQHMDEGGSIVNSGYKKTSGRLNVTHRFSPKTKLSLTTNLIHTESNRGVTGNDNTNITYGFSIGFTPSFIDIRKDSDGTWPDHPINPSNPLHTARVFKNTEFVNRSIGSINLSHSLLKSKSMSLDWITTAGADFYAQENNVFAPAELQFEKNKDEAGQSIDTKTNSLNSNLYSNLVHRLILGDMRMTSTGGIQFETSDWDQVFVHAKGMVVGQTNVDQASSANVYQTRKKQQDRGFFVQEEVNFKDQINVAVGLRGDRSSTLGDTKAWNTYPKFSVSYQAGELVNIFDSFKGRLAWGQTGNLPSPTAKFTSLIPRNISGVGGLTPSSTVGNSDIVPERTTEIEYGVDFAFLDRLGNVEFTIYSQNIEDLILQVDQAASSGAQFKWENAAEMETKGMEFSLVLNPIRSKSMDWLATLNYYTTSSEITKLNVDPFNMGGFATFLGTYRIEEGWSPTSIIGSDTTATGGIMKLGDETPDFQMSFNNSFRMGDFTFQFLLDKKVGGDIINLANLIYDLGGTTADYDSKKLDPDGELTDGPYRLNVLGSVTAPYIEDGSYVKLREVSLFYNVPDALVNNVFRGRASGVRLGLSGRNLMTWTDYSGVDPEVSQFGNIAIGGSVDTNPFPPSRSVYFSFSIDM